MRIALLAPITHRLPPLAYGPWEQVVADLADGLVDAGHEVTLFCTAESCTSAIVVVTTPHPLGEWPDDLPAPDHRIWEEMHVAEAIRHVAGDGFDVLHSHMNVHPLGFARLIETPIITTLHGSAWNTAIHPALERYRDLPFVSISNAERALCPGLNYVATVHNGIDTDRFDLGDGSGGYVLFAGRMAPEKRPHLAIEAARGAGIPIRLAGPVEPRHRDYFARAIQPSLGSPGVEYLGEVRRSELARLYGEAIALLMPLGWDEPFGLVVVESLASGTPVVGWRRGALPELIEDGVTGALVEDVPGAVAAIGRHDQFDRVKCRADAESRFGIPVMARGYLGAYETVLARSSR
jgi:glycosyltransferase involved in cell wall biosynthesis